MKKKSALVYPSMSSPKVDQFTLAELSFQLLKSKQFIKGIQSLFSSCVITKSEFQSLQPLSNSKNFKTKERSTPTQTAPLNKRFEDSSSTFHQTQESILVSDEQTESDNSMIFHKSNRDRQYPWITEQNNKEELFDCNFITEEISNLIQETIQCGLHKVLSRQFNNVTNQILVMREELTKFTQEQIQRTETLKLDFKKEINKIQKKVQQQKHTSAALFSQPHKNALNINLPIKSNTSSRKAEQATDQKMIIDHEIVNLKKDVQILKNSIGSNAQQKKLAEIDIIRIQEKLQITQENLYELNLNLKLSMQEQKQKCRKGHEQLSSQLAATTSKDCISHQVKKIVKSNFKIYLDEIMKCKKQIQNLYDEIEKHDKGMQDYFANQLKNVWTLVQGIKTRVEYIEEQCEVRMDQSFVL